MTGAAAPDAAPPTTLDEALERLREAEDTLRAIGAGEVDAFVVSGGGSGGQVFTLSTADRPYRKFVEEMREGAATLSADGIVLYANRRLAELLGQRREAILGSRLQLASGDGDEVVLEVLRGQGGAGTTLELVLLDASGAAVPVLVGTSPLEVDGAEMTCLTFTDLTAQKAQEREIARLGAAQAARLADLQGAQAALVEQATHDALTGLPNRNLLVDRLEQALAHASRSGATVALYFVDLDGFKQVNDSFGHAAGDALLQLVASQLVAALRPMDTVARIGGDEFIVLAPDVAGRKHAVELGQRLSVELGRDGGTGCDDVSASIGMTLSTGGRGSAEVLLNEADIAMYEAKSRGGRRVEEFDEALRRQLRERVLGRITGNELVTDPLLAADALLVGNSRSNPRLLRAALVELGFDPGAIRTAASLRQARVILALGSVGCILVDLSSAGPDDLEAVAVLATAAPETPVVVVTGRPPEAEVELAPDEAAIEPTTNAPTTSAATTGDAAVADDRWPRVQAGVGRRLGPVAADRAAEVGAQVLEAIQAATAAIDGLGQIIETNQAWIDASVIGGAPLLSTGVGVNYLSVCDVASGADTEGASEAATGIRSVLAGERDEFSMDYPCHAKGIERWFSLRVVRLARVGGGALITHLDVSGLKTAERQLLGEGKASLRAQSGASPIYALLDERGTVVHRSDLTCALLSIDADTPVGSPLFQRVDPADLGRATQVFAEVVAHAGRSSPLAVRVTDGTGRTRRLDLVLTNRLDDPLVGAVVVTGSDITEGRRIQVTRQLESTLLGRLPAAVVVTDELGVIVYWNDRATAVFGHLADSVLGKSIAGLDLSPCLPEESLSSAGATWEGTYDARRADGSRVPIQTTMERLDDGALGFHGVMRASIDISHQRRLESALHHLARHDRLTGLPNRRMLVDQLDGAIGRGERIDGFIAALAVDLDDFTAMNDAIGEVAGDEVLRTVADLIAGIVRPGDTVARVGGDRFAVSLEGVADADEACGLADLVQQVLRAPFRFGGKLVKVGVSVGVALSRPSMQGEALLRNAEAAMEVAKRGGKARTELFDDAVAQQARRNLDLAVDLERAIGAGELVTYFQPGVDLATNEVIGFEALVRWHHPERGLVLPDEFISVAEERGLIGRVGAVVLADACNALASWSVLAPDRRLTVAVNVSAHQLADPHLAEVVRSCAGAAGIHAGSICLEVTESALMDEVVAGEALRALRATGVSIAIDDFGTGYSSLSRLKRFDVDFLKIDREFVAGLGSNSEDDAIVAAVVGLGRSLHLRLVAEGIETPSQLAHLVGLGCDFGQGYLWARPLPLAEATAIVVGTSTLAGPPRPSSLKSRPATPADVDARRTA